ncbi:Egd2 protein [Saccharomycopsis crataegensis]|uniref:Nascent polypeptide-associated complex subunit alpha n=1 Tax=Saccharomycopsis crataegensis TaxID=43959 RepID=A0AAV5QST2_9ASCO|nr:Egd2 protein [Saccharomycopsis crataegensis]
MSLEEIPAGAEVSVFSKNEKKARKLFTKLNLKKVEGISRVTFKRKGNQVFGIDRPEVFKSASGTYIVFGEAKLENLAERYKQAAEAQAKLKENSPEALKNAAESIQAAAADKSPASIQADLQAAAEAPKIEAEEEEEVDETGVDPEDIKIVVAQTNVSRAKAVKALKENNNDMVNAIMSLS